MSGCRMMCPHELRWFQTREKSWHLAILCSLIVVKYDYHIFLPLDFKTYWKWLLDPYYNFCGSLGALGLRFEEIITMNKSEFFIISLQYEELNTSHSFTFLSYRFTPEKKVCILKCSILSEATHGLTTPVCLPTLFLHET